jgi:hypothetical protein
MLLRIDIMQNIRLNCFIVFNSVLSKLETIHMKVLE